MEVITDLDDVPRLQNPVVAVGAFDGIHLGHRQIFSYVKDHAKQINGVSVVVTFDPHPQVVLHPNTDFFQIFPLEENIRLIGEEDIDYLIVIHFTKTFSQLSPQDFIQQIIRDKIGAKALVMGPSHSFGHQREGNCNNIADWCQENQIEIINIPEFVFNDLKVRSAQIRKLIANNNWDIADELLGRKNSF
ncbi:MAG: FAD synthetase family protein [Bacteroidales bacterium]|nr:FAD synthetase family protein [Bacteroidales bacterium]